jgi:phosphoserine phosphatase RsbU/P
VLEVVNRALRQRPGVAPVTMLCVRLREGGLTLAVGGHPLPLLVRADGHVEPIGRPGTLLGVLPDPEVHEATVHLEPGDALVLYTDGVIEASPLDDALGPDRLTDVLRGCAGLDASAIATCVEQRTLEVQHGRLRDDVAVVVLRATTDASRRLPPQSVG